MASNDHQNLELAIYIKPTKEGRQYYWLVMSYAGKIDLDKISLDGLVQLYSFYTKDGIKRKLDDLATVGFPYVPFIPDLDGQMSLDSLRSNTSDVPYYLIGCEQIRRGNIRFVAQLMGTDIDGYLGEYTVILLRNQNLGLSYCVDFSRNKRMSGTKLFIR